MMVLQVVSLCWAHGLYNGILYIHNRAMQDYVTPLEQLLALLSAAVSTGKQLTYEQVGLTCTSNSTLHITPTGHI